MTFDEHADGPDVGEPGQLSAPRGSGLAGLRGKRAKAIAGLHIDLPVQRSEELFGQRIIVRYRPVTAKESEGTRKRFAKDKRDDVDVIANSVVLAKCCLGIFTDVERNDPDAWMKFNKELAELLLTDDEGNVDQEALDKVAGADEVVRLLYATDGDVIATAMKLGEFSGFDEVLAESSGN